MYKAKQIYLPGTDKQIEYLSVHYDFNGKSILIIGTGTEEIAKILESYGSEIIIITDDQENLIQMKYLLTEHKNISVRMMEFDNTDFNDERFDVVYAQASVSTAKRNKIVKEIKRILKPSGIFCVGEIVQLTEEAPKFVADIWETSDIIPLLNEKLMPYYKEKNFKIVFEKDISSTLKDYYLAASKRLKDNKEMLSENEQSFFKKILKKISHESNAYLNLGGDAHIGFKMLILRKP